MAITSPFTAAGSQFTGALPQEVSSFFQPGGGFSQNNPFYTDAQGYNWGMQPGDAIGNDDVGPARYFRTNTPGAMATPGNSLTYFGQDGAQQNTWNVEAPGIFESPLIPLAILSGGLALGGGLGALGTSAFGASDAAGLGAGATGLGEAFGPSLTGGISSTFPASAGFGTFGNTLGAGIGGSTFGAGALGLDSALSAFGSAAGGSTLSSIFSNPLFKQFAPKAIGGLLNGAAGGGAAPSRPAGGTTNFGGGMPVNTNGVNQAFGNILGGFNSNLNQTGAGFGQALGGMAQNTNQGLESILGGFGAGLGQTGSGFDAALQRLAQAAAGGIGQTAGGFGQALGGVAQNANNGVQAADQGFGNALGGIAQNAGQNTNSLMSSFGSGLQSILGGIGGGMSGLGKQLGNLGNMGLSDLIGLIGGGVDASEQGKATNTMIDWLHSQQDKMDSYGKPGSPEFDTLWDQMSRKDAAAGRNSQYGPRSVQLAGELAKTKADNTLRFTTGTSRALADALNQRAARFSGLSSAAQRAAQMGNLLGGVGQGLSGIQNPFGGFQNAPESGINQGSSGLSTNSQLSNQDIEQMMGGGLSGSTGQVGGFGGNGRGVPELGEGVQSGIPLWDNAFRSAQNPQLPTGGFLGQGVESGVPEWDLAMQKAMKFFDPNTSLPTGGFLGENVPSGVPDWDRAFMNAQQGIIPQNIDYLGEVFGNNDPAMFGGADALGGLGGDIPFDPASSSDIWSMLDGWI